MLREGFINYKVDIRRAAYLTVVTSIYGLIKELNAV